MTDLIALVRAYAEEHFYSESWDLVALDWTDEQITAAISGAKTRRGAIAKAWGVLQVIDRKRARRDRPVKALSLLEFIAAGGGVRSTDKMIGDLRQTLGGNAFLPPHGWVIREPKELSTAARMGGVKAPKFLDAWREAAVEAGYLQDATWGEGASDTTVNDLLEAIDDEFRCGLKLYPHGEAPFQHHETREESRDEIPF